MSKVTWRQIGIIGLVAGIPLTGCQPTGGVDLRAQNARLERELRAKENRLVEQQATIEELEAQLAVARAISESDLEVIFYPERLEIDKLTGGADYDNEPGDDGVTVYLKPIDRYGDIVKIPGDVTISLYDLAAERGQELISEYRIPVDRLAELWHGKLLTGHFTIKCPFPPNRIPEHRELTVRAVFVDYLTKRVVSAQRTCTFDRAPQ